MHKAIQPLRALYESDATACAVLDRLAARTYNSRTTKVDTLVAALTSSGHTRAQIIGVLRRLDELGLGRFVTGRRGKPTRFEWGEFSSRNIAEAASGASDELEASEDPEEGDADFFDHTFHLRSDYVFRFRLPGDLSTSEAERLALFMRSLPLSDGE